MTAALMISQSGTALAHGFAGDHFFPATIVTNDPFVADELVLPSVSNQQTGTGPAVAETDIGGGLQKSITPDLGFSIGSDWTQFGQAGPPHGVSGFQNLAITAPQYQFLLNARHEAVASVGLITELGGTGAMRVGAPEFSTFVPTVFFGKGAGDLPASLRWARPIGVSGSFGYAIPSRGTSTSTIVDANTGIATLAVNHNPDTVDSGFAIEYSMLYLRAHVHDFHLPEWVNQLTPLIEFNFTIPVGDRYGWKTVGMIYPGIVWAGKFVQFGIEAMIPATSASGDNVGIIAQLHFYLDDMFPQSIGRPIIER
jgi:hypothetical protein